MSVGATQLLLPGMKPEEEHQGTQGCIFPDQFLAHTWVPTSPTGAGITGSLEPHCPASQADPERSVLVSLAAVTTYPQLHVLEPHTLLHSSAVQKSKILSWAKT